MAKTSKKEMTSMKKTLLAVPLALAVATACSSKDDDAGPAPSEVDASTTDERDAAPTTPEGDGAPTPDANEVDAADASTPATCTAAREQLLKPIDSVSTGEVTVLATDGAVKTIFVDASAGGPAGAATSPRIYVSLESATKAPVTDKTAAASTAWDLAIERPILFTNGGDGGPGTGGARLVAKDLADVTVADATGLATESFFEPDCTAKVDATGAVKTTFDGWYDYDTATNALSPHAGTWIVRGATGKLFKLQITSYYATSDGGVGMSGGRYTIRVGAL